MTYIDLTLDCIIAKYLKSYYKIINNEDFYLENVKNTKLVYDLLVYHDAAISSVEDIKDHFLIYADTNLHFKLPQKEVYKIDGLDIRNFKSKSLVNKFRNEVTDCDGIIFFVDQRDLNIYVFYYYGGRYGPK